MPVALKDEMNELESSLNKQKRMRRMAFTDDAKEYFDLLVRDLEKRIREIRQRKKVIEHD